jgi:hypothetical protein
VNNSIELVNNSAGFVNNSKLKLCLYSAGAHDTPTAKGFEQRKSATNTQRATPPPRQTRHEQTAQHQGQAQERSDDSACRSYVWCEQVVQCPFGNALVPA